MENTWPTEFNDIFKKLEENYKPEHHCLDELSKLQLLDFWRDLQKAYNRNENGLQDMFNPETGNLTLIGEKDWRYYAAVEIKYDWHGKIYDFLLPYEFALEPDWEYMEMFMQAIFATVVPVIDLICQACPDLINN